MIMQQHFTYTGNSCLIFAHVLGEANIQWCLTKMLCMCLEVIMGKLFCFTQITSTNCVSFI